MRTRTGTKCHFGEMDPAGPRNKFDSENVHEHGSESGKVSEVGEISLRFPKSFQRFWLTGWGWSGKLEWLPWRRL